jgi:hypothetical protein
VTGRLGAATAGQGGFFGRRGALHYGRDLVVVVHVHVYFFLILIV